MRRRAGPFAEIPVWAAENSAEKFSYKRPARFAGMNIFRDACAALKTQPEISMIVSFVEKYHSVLATVNMNLHFELKLENSSYPSRDFDDHMRVNNCSQIPPGKPS